MSAVSTAACVRDQAMGRLAERLSSRRISQLRYEDVANVDPRTKYVEVRRILVVRDSDRAVFVDDNLAEALENYLTPVGAGAYAPAPTGGNAQPPGRAYADFRPESAGPYLFPSPKSVVMGDRACALRARAGLQKPSHVALDGQPHRPAVPPA